MSPLSSETPLLELKARPVTDSMRIRHPLRLAALLLAFGLLIAAAAWTTYKVSQSMGLAELQATAIDAAEAEAIALANALLNEEQPIVKAELVDGVLVLTRRDGVELTVEGSTSLAPSSVVWRLPWQAAAW